MLNTKASSLSEVEHVFTTLPNEFVVSALSTGVDIFCRGPTYTLCRKEKLDHVQVLENGKVVGHLLFDDNKALKPFKVEKFKLTLKNHAIFTATFLIERKK